MREHYLQWLIFCSRGQRWLTFAAPLLILLGTWIVVAEPEGGYAKLMSTFMIMIGAYELFVAPLIQYRHWRKTLLKGRSKLPDLILEVRDGVLLVGGDAGGQFISVKNSVKVWRGNFFYIDGQSGGHVYLPDRWAARSDVQALLANCVNSTRP